MFITPGLGNSW